jgi:hypothetical protein
MKLVGGDSGRVEREELVEDVIVAPSERVVVDVQFDAEREAALEHRTPETTYRLASVTVSEDEVEPLDFETLRENADLAAERERIAPYFEAAPDKTLSLVAEMDMAEPSRARQASSPAPCTRRSSRPGKASARSAG